MSSLDAIKAGGECIRYLRASGFEVEQVGDAELIKDLIADTKKEWFTRTMSGDFNDFTSANHFWLVARKADNVCGVLGARLDTIPDKISAFWASQQKRLYGNGHQVLDPSHVPPIAETMKGKAAYFGDLFLASEERVPLEQFVLLGYSIAYAKWAPNWYYAFVKERRMSAQIRKLRMPHVYPGAQRWLRPVAQRDDRDWLICMSDADFIYSLGDFLWRSEKARVAQS
ncbi:MAG: hypothetical protein AAF674_16590 [Pseudomonadota bacterium]